MDDYNVRFEWLLDRFHREIADECSLFKGKSPNEDLYEAALIGLFHADITYQEGIMEFDSYVRNSIREAIKNVISQNHSQVEFSFNRKVNETANDVDLPTLLKAPTSDWDSKIMMSDFVTNLDLQHRHIACELLGNATIEDIIVESNFTREEIEIFLRNMRDYWEVRYGEDFM